MVGERGRGRRWLVWAAWVPKQDWGQGAPQERRYGAESHERKERKPCRKHGASGIALPRPRTYCSWPGMCVWGWAKGHPPPPPICLPGSAVSCSIGPSGMETPCETSTEIINVSSADHGMGLWNGNVSEKGSSLQRPCRAAASEGGNPAGHLWAVALGVGR